MTLAEIDGRIPRYREKGLLVDANLLLLYLIGELEMTLVPRFKRTRGFTVDEFLLVKAIVESFSRVVTTPGVLTEVSNLAGHLEGKWRPPFFTLLAEKVQSLQEEYIPSRHAAHTVTFQKLGLTDSAIILACEGRYLAFTADFPLANFMETNRLDVLNFNHIRSTDWH